MSPATLAQEGEHEILPRVTVKVEWEKKLFDIQCGSNFPFPFILLCKLFCKFIYVELTIQEISNFDFPS